MGEEHVEAIDGGPRGRTLDRRIAGDLELPPVGLQTFVAATVLVFMPIYDRMLCQRCGA